MLCLTQINYRILFGLATALLCASCGQNGEDGRLYGDDLDLTTFCPKSATHRYDHHLILVDSSDLLSDTALKEFKNLYLSDERIARMKPYDRLSIVHMVGLEPGATARSIFSLCRPRNGDENSIHELDHHNFLVEAVPVLKANYDRFKQSVNTAVENIQTRQEELGDCEGKKCSPIMEYVTNISRLDHFGFNQDAGYQTRHLTIVSDLIQNSDRFDFYKECRRTCPSWSDFVKRKKLSTQLVDKFLPQFGGPIVIRAFYLGTERKFDNKLEKNVTDLWKSYFEASNQTDFGFTISVLGG